MSNYEEIIKSVSNDKSIHCMMLNSTKEEILNSTIEGLAEIINHRMDKKPCDYYCSNCNEKGVLLSICKERIINWLNKQSNSFIGCKYGTVKFNNSYRRLNKKYH